LSVQRAPNAAEARSRPSASAKLPTKAVISMGDKSPKAKAKSKKQDAADKSQKAAVVASAKANQAAAGTLKRSK
jgi:hypothetical protein